ncbi:YopT-type cysteine protease domain-containing protein [Histophilus somni]|uniref:YopT-type cysteine protease domain-containing protein n=2 Tax=Histophilus somni TaxID=731 RepID=A0AAX2S313_HISSO|nr:YopT-type cysteine protease domain-containing protein [Histophilus somni]TEW30120.1 YopT-type cysteine protease domain-containing protein [Histophilus somni]TFF01693.1 YopT-type cysteine protease domain-containing protein [Histophilus somni]
MNKNCYKLIFSKTRGCLVPVAECITSAVDSGSSDSVVVSEKTDEEDRQGSIEDYRLSNVCLSVKTFLNPVSSALCLNWKSVSVLLLSMVAAPNFAQSAGATKTEKKPQLTDITSTNNNNDVQLDTSYKNQTGAENTVASTKLYKTENNVIVIDIAKPNDKGISDNRFQKFNIPNGAVFKNNKDQQRSELVGYLEGNKNLADKEAKVILNQVTGSELSQIKGALEILGTKADLVIANQNGITLNGVKTINAGRFVATTSSTIDPSNGTMEFNITDKGTVTIDVNGFATDNLPYLDIIAKKIEQKGTIKNKESSSKVETEITFIAGTGKTKYSIESDDKTKLEVQKDSSTSQTSTEEVAITGASTGAMHGKSIKLIVTDQGAGVKHDGIILSESDIKIESNKGDIDLGDKLQAKNEISLNNAKRITIANEITADKSITITADDVKLKNNKETPTTEDAKLKNKGKLASKKVKVEVTKSLVLDEETKVVATDLELKSQTLTNQGRIYGHTVKIDTDKLVNKKEIYAEDNLDITTKGKTVTVSINKDNKRKADVKEETVADLDVGFENTGTIESKSKAKLTFKDGTSFVSKGNHFIKAKDELTIDAKNVVISENDELQTTAKLTINAAGNVVNNGLLASGKTLTINAQKGNIYNEKGILGAREQLTLSAKGNNKETEGNIINGADSLLHSEGKMELDAENTVYNLGNIFAKSDLTVKANELINDVQLSGKVSKGTNSSVLTRYRRSDIASHGWHNNDYRLWINPIEFEKAEVKVEKAGLIRAEGNFKFEGKKGDSQQEATLTNHGVINVKNTFEAQNAKVVNNMKAYQANLLNEFFKQKQEITFNYQPRARLFLSALSGNAERKFDSLESFFDGLFSEQPITSSSSYYADNSQAMHLLKEIKSDTFQKAMVQVFGADWRNSDHKALSERWKSFKEKQDAHFDYRPNDKAKILAGRIQGEVKALENGSTGGFSENEQITVGQHKFDLSKVEFRSEVNGKENLNNSNVDLSALSDLLSIPNLFVDNSVQLDKTVDPNIEIEDEDDLALLQKPNKGSEEPDLLNPDELKTNGKFLDKLLKDVGEDIYALSAPENYKEGDQEEPDYLNERETDTRERFDTLPTTVQEKLLAKFQELKKESQQKRQAEALRAKTKNEQLQSDLETGYKEEEKRQEKSALEKQAELKQIAQQETEKLAEEKKLQGKIEEEKQQEALAKQKQEEQKQADAKAKVEEEKRLEEYRKELAKDHQIEEALSKNQFLKEVDDTRPKVETDPLYRTKLQYINQDEYFGSKYFLNKVGSSTDAGKKVAVIGDNYLEHQLITKSIEKKVDNHLALKYQVNDAQLVKKLIDNSYFESKELGLKVGEALTKEQQNQLKQDIVWYVKANINNKEVLLPQVYFANKTLRDAEKFKGLGDALIRANEINLKTRDVLNSGTISGKNIDIEAENKIKNRGDILSEESTRLVGHKGIDNTARSFVNGNGDVEVQRASIRTEGHLHLEADEDSDINSKGSDIKGKTGFVKARNFNTTDTHRTEHSVEKGRIFSKKGEILGYRKESTQKAISVGSNTEFDHVHFAIKNDVNQEGSKIKAKVVTGVVQGDYNTKAGRNAQQTERYIRLDQEYSSGHISGAGFTVSHERDSQNGEKTNIGGASSNTGTGFTLGGSFSETREKETSLTHTNSDLQVDHGILHVLKKAEIGGVDINKHKFTGKAVEEDEAKAEQQAKAKAAPDATDNAAQKEEPKFKVLSQSEVDDLMTEKSANDLFNKYKKVKEDEGFELSAKEITSNKQKDEYHLDSERSVLKFGIETEGHSAIADAVSHVAKEIVEAQRGVKQDGTVALQHISDVANIVTGELVGGSSKFGFERNYETNKVKETSDIRTKIAGNITLSAHGGNLQLKNVESDANSKLTLQAKRNVDILDGETTRESTERQSRQKFAFGINSGCSVMSGGCNGGVSGSVDGNESFTTEKSVTHNNSLLRAKNLKIAAGEDLNLISSNIKADHLDLNIKGKTNIVSKQDSFDRLYRSIDFSASAGAALSSSTLVKGNGSFGAGYTHEVENRKLLNQQAGIVANRITGQIKDLDLVAAHFINKDENSGFRVSGNVTSQQLNDSHHKDGGSVGVSVGINERGASSFNVRGGRAEQKHYDAVQKSVISGINLKDNNVTGEIVDDLSKAKTVTRDDVYASTQFNFEVADLVELGEKAKSKLQSKFSKAVNNDAEQPTTTRISSEDVVEMVDNPLYGSNADVRKLRTLDEVGEGYSTLGDQNANKGRKLPNGSDDIYSLLGKVKVSGDEPVYDKVSAEGAYDLLGDSNANKGRTLRNNSDDLYSTVGDANSDISRIRSNVYDEIAAGPYSLLGRTKAAEEHIYEQIGEGPYSLLGNGSAVRNRILGGESNSTYSTVGDANSDISRIRSNVYDEIAAGPYSLLGKPKAAEEHIYEQIGEGPYSLLGNGSAVRNRTLGGESDSPYSLLGGEGTRNKVLADTIESIYSTLSRPQASSNLEMVDNPLYDSVRRSASDQLPELPTVRNLLNSDTEAGNGTYSEITSRTRNANDPLPPLPNEFRTRLSQGADLADHVYDTIGSIYSVLSKPKASSNIEMVDNPLYGSVRRSASDQLPELPTVRSLLSKVEEVGNEIYSEITSKTRSANDPLPELPNFRLTQEVDTADHIYADINDVVNRANKAKRDLPAIPEATPKVAVDGGDYATIGELSPLQPRASRQQGSSDYEEIPLPQETAPVKRTSAEGEDGYATIAEVLQPRSAKGQVSDYETIPLDEPSQTAVRTERSAVEGDYAEITSPSLIQPRSARGQSNGEEFEPIPSSELSSEPQTPKRALPAENAVVNELVNELKARLKSKEDRANTAKPEVNEPIYATLDKSPEGLARAKAKGDEAAAANPIVKARVEDDVAPELPPRPSNLSDPVSNETVAENGQSAVLGTPRSALAESNRNNNGNQKLQSEGAEGVSPKAKSDEKSWFAKVKDFFFAKSNKSQAKEAKSEQETASKPNYDSLEDDLNLKNLLALEDKRGSSFEENVLKNPEFLAEAREIAKKYIPEATIKQMGNSPEFDEILTEGAKKVEKRINDALTFKPSVDEFNEIQGLVKNIQKGSAVDDLNAQTLAITEALADTSKTIQRNPKLKEEVQGAIEEFLKSSQGKELTVEMIEKLNHGLRPDEGSDRLLYKKENLTKENAVFSSPQASKIQLNETVDFINQAIKQNVEPSVLAGLVYQRLIAYHPFAEGNGRMARVVVNKILLDAGYPPFTKFSSEFETQIIPQTKATAKSATSAEVVKEFLTELGKKSSPQEGGANNQNGQATSPVTLKSKDVSEVENTQSADSLTIKQPEQGKAGGQLPSVPKVETSVNEVAPLSSVPAELKDAAGGNKKAAEKSEGATGVEKEKTTLFQRVKQFFTGSKSGAKPVAGDETANKVNYQDLEDNLNLKGLISLEDDRNANFESNVLKNEKFLDEAREISKKSIPEATVKQMSHLPEFDDILTEGAKKVESRINKAITFRPSVEEFSEIQDLVKTLPKTKVIEDLSTKTNEITEALAATSKTIQRTPELKEQLKTAIEDFLQNSQGKPLTVQMIENLNHGLRPDEGEGRLLYKKENLTKENAVFSSPEAAKIQLAETVDFINRAKNEGIEPSVVGALVYQRLIAYHPFAEGNGRMARVIVNKILLDAGYPAFTKFSDEFEPQIIPQTKASTKSATSSEVVVEFLKELAKKGSKEDNEQNLEKTDRTSTDLTESAVENSAALSSGTVRSATVSETVTEMEQAKAKPVSDLVSSKDLVEQQRTVLQRIQDQFQPLKVKSKIDAVRSSVEEFGGEVSFKFAQSKGEVYKEIVKHIETQNGVCESTCAHWIAKNVNPTDENFFNTLYEGGKKGHLKKETIDSIKKLQTEFINSGSATQQFKLTDSWLQEQGVVPKEKKVADFVRRDEVSGTVSKNDVSSLVKAILDTGDDTAGVKKISINLEGGSHTVSAAVDGSKVTFFDPNFGEMTFPTHQQFENWLKNAFWQKSGYAGKQEGRRFFNVVNYKKIID